MRCTVVRLTNVNIEGPYDRSTNKKNKKMMRRMTVRLTFKSEGSYNHSSKRGSTCLFIKKRKKKKEKKK